MTEPLRIEPDSTAMEPFAGKRDERHWTIRVCRKCGSHHGRFHDGCVTYSHPMYPQTTEYAGIDSIDVVRASALDAVHAEVMRLEQVIRADQEDHERIVLALGEQVDAVRREERERVVAWLRAIPHQIAAQWAADKIEREFGSRAKGPESAGR